MFKRTKFALLPLVLALAISFSVITPVIVSALSDSSTVYIASSGKGKKYHIKKSCRTLKKGKTTELTLKKAKNKGYKSACKVCSK